MRAKNVWKSVFRLERELVLETDVGAAVSRRFQTNFFESTEPVWPESLNVLALQWATKHGAGYLMIARRDQLLNSALVFTDVGACLLACQASYWMLIERGLLNGLWLTVCLTLVLGVVVTSSAAGLYRSQRGKSIWRELQTLFICWLLLILFVGSALFTTKTGEAISRLWLGISMLITFALLVGVRVIIRTLLQYGRQMGFNRKRIVVVGAGRIGESIAERLSDRAEAGFEIVAFFDDDPERIGQAIYGKKVHRLEAVRHYLETATYEGKAIDQIWVAIPGCTDDMTKKMLSELSECAAELFFVPTLLGDELVSASIETVAGVPLITGADGPLAGLAMDFKILFDYIVSALAVILLSPVLLIIALAIKLESDGPIIFRQKRYGVRGHEIMVWKFRTMYHSSDKPFKQANRLDPRVTRVGAFLRRSSLDELPQFFNVLQGTMSIVGPRPHAIEHTEEFRSKVPYYMIRHKIKPGITGLAQVSGFRGETDTDHKMRGRVDHDLEYIRSWSFGLDIRIIARTVREVFVSPTAY